MSGSSQQVSIQYPWDKTLTARPPRPEPGTGSGGATCQEEDAVAIEYGFGHPGLGQG
ncbi:MAG: hypothetical protein JRI52_07225 [Deltaproteobacteria bacterium]|nr:hypothetical protein [Deltaproteobacteria bacterium]